MSRRYTAEEKANALVHLQMNGGDITYTARQLGIPERTLFDWCRDWYAENPPPQPAPPRLQRPDFEDDLDALAYLRKQIMAELLNMADSFRDGTIFSTPAQRIHLLSQLLDRLIKLDQHLQPYKPPVEEIIRITWEAGLYLRTEAGYRGPHSPLSLPRNWKEKYGPSTRLEIYWGDHTFTPLTDEHAEFILDVKDFNAEPCDIVRPDDHEAFDYPFG